MLVILLRPLNVCFLSLPNLNQRLSGAFPLEMCLVSVCPSICLYVVNFFFRNTACQVTKLTTNLPREVLKKCCKFYSF